VDRESWKLARDEAKIGRVRDAMRKEGFDTLVLHVPENVTYLSDAWCGQGLTYLIFPLEVAVLAYSSQVPTVDEIRSSC
jgi:Xaa-Pro aminopeptidase